MRAGNYIWYGELEEIKSGNSFDWWDKIDESEEWQRGIYYTLSVAYALVSIVALVIYGICDSL